MKSASCNILLGFKDEARWRDDMAERAESVKGALIGRDNTREAVGVVRPIVMADSHICILSLFEVLVR
jgi:hypothetical protein